MKRVGEWITHVYMPTIKEQKLAREIANNLNSGDTLTGGQMLEKVGYSKGLQKQPGRVISQEGVQEELNKLIPDELLTEKHLALLNKKEIVVTKESGIVYTGQPHSDVKGALDMAYKVKGDYAPEKRAIESKVLNVNVDANQEEVDLIVKEAEEKMLKLLSE